MDASAARSNGASPKVQAEQPPRLADILNRLDVIRRELDRDDLDLEDQLTLYAEGARLTLSAKRILAEVRAQVDILESEVDEIPTRGVM